MNDLEKAFKKAMASLKENPLTRPYAVHAESRQEMAAEILKNPEVGELVKELRETIDGHSTPVAIGLVGLMLS